MVDKDLGRNTIGKLVASRSREGGTSINFSEWGSNIQIFVSHGNVHQGVIQQRRILIIR